MFVVKFFNIHIWTHHNVVHTFSKKQGAGPPWARLEATIWPQAETLLFWMWKVEFIRAPFENVTEPMLATVFLGILWTVLKNPFHSPPYNWLSDPLASLCQMLTNEQLMRLINFLWYIFYYWITVHFLLQSNTAIGNTVIATYFCNTFRAVLKPFANPRQFKFLFFLTAHSLHFHITRPRAGRHLSWKWHVCFLEDRLFLRNSAFTVSFWFL